jgi:hypothetical protein
MWMRGRRSRIGPRKLAFGLAMVAVGLAGCGGAASSGDWSAGKRLANRDLLGRCATAAGPDQKMLVVCRSGRADAFAHTCWAVPGGTIAALHVGAWVEAENDPDCKAAERAVDDAGLLRSSG